MSYLIDYTPRAKRSLAKIKAYHKRPIQAAIAKLATNPRPRRSIELTGQYQGVGLRRLSVKKWRVIYEIDDIDKIVLIEDVRLKTGPETYHDIDAD